MLIVPYVDHFPADSPETLTTECTWPFEAINISFGADGNGLTGVQLREVTVNLPKSEAQRTYGIDRSVYRLSAQAKQSLRLMSPELKAHERAVKSMRS